MAEPEIKWWFLDDALKLIRRLQPEVRPLGYHIALGGGVLNIGRSKKDLDLYFLPLVDEQHHEGKLIILLHEKWGEGSPIGSVSQEPRSMYSYKMLFTLPKGRIDVFIADSTGLDPVTKQEKEEFDANIC